MRDYSWFREVGRAASRLLNAITGGNGATTSSAHSYLLVVLRSPWGPPRVAVVDFLARDPGHCRRAYEWHLARGLLTVELT